MFQVIPNPALSYIAVCVLDSEPKLLLGGKTAECFVCEVKVYYVDNIPDEVPKYCVRCFKMLAKQKAN